MADYLAIHYDYKCIRRGKRGAKADFWLIFEIKILLDISFKEPDVDIKY